MDNSSRMISQNSSVNDELYRIDHMDGHSFEYWCADLLRYNGFSNVQVTRGSGDQGVDILAEKGGIRYAFQCKCFSSPLGNKPVQEVYTGKEVYNCHVGVVMTNQFFTDGAKEAAKQTKVLLWNRDVLKTMLRKFLPDSRPEQTAQESNSIQSNYSSPYNNAYVKMEAFSPSKPKHNTNTSRSRKFFVLYLVAFLLVVRACTSSNREKKPTQTAERPASETHIITQDSDSILDVNQSTDLNGLSISIVKYAFARHNGNLKYQDMADEGLVNLVVYADICNYSDQCISTKSLTAILLCDGIEYQQMVLDDQKFLFYYPEIQPSESLTSRIINFQIPKDQQYTDSDTIITIILSNGASASWKLR